jgi:hypothetical protein
VKEIQISTRASNAQLAAAWARAFEPPGFMESRLSPSKQIARGCRWRDVRVEGALLAKELVEQRDLGSQMIANHSGSNSGSVIALSVTTPGNGPRSVTIYNPLFKRGVLGTNQFAKTFRILAKRVLDEIQTS